MAEGQATPQGGTASRPLTWVERGDALARGMGQAELGVAGICISLSLGISLYTVIARALLIPTSEWVLNLPLELLAAASFFGAGGLITREGHIGVEFMLDLLPARPAALLRGLVSAALGGVCLFLVTRGIEVTRQTLAIHLTIPEIFDLPVAIPTGLGTTAIFLWALHFAWLAVRHWVGLRRGGSPPFAAGRA